MKTTTATSTPRPSEQPIVALNPKAWSVLLRWKNLLNLTLILPGVMVGWEYLKLTHEKYFFTTRRVRKENGVFNVETDDVMLFRVIDMKIRAPFLYRFFGLANLYIYSRDLTNKLTVIQAISISDAKKLFDLLQMYIDIERRNNPHDPPYRC